MIVRIRSGGVGVGQISFAGWWSFLRYGMESSSNPGNLKAELGGDLAKGAGICRKAAWHSSRFKYPDVIDVNSQLKSNKQINQSNNSSYRKRFDHQTNHFILRVFPTIINQGSFSQHLVNSGDVSEVAPSAEMHFSPLQSHQPNNS